MFKFYVIKMDVETYCEGLPEPYKCEDSFIAKRDGTGERITVTLEGAPTDSQVNWACEDAPEDGIDSGGCTIVTEDNAALVFEPGAYPEPNGRNGPLSYQISVEVTLNGMTRNITRIIRQDTLDVLRQEYEDMPQRDSQERMNFDTDPPVHEGLLGVAAESRHDPWHILRELNGHAVETANNYIINYNRSLRITSGYRCPIGNSRLPDSVANSNHQNGRAFDFVQGSSQENYNAFRAAVNAGAGGDSYLKAEDAEYYDRYYIRDGIPPPPDQLPTGWIYTQGHVAW